MDSSISIESIPFYTPTKACFLPSYDTSPDLPETRLSTRHRLLDRAMARSQSESCSETNTNCRYKDRASNARKSWFAEVLGELDDQFKDIEITQEKINLATPDIT